MALADTITAIACVPQCDLITELDDSQFLALLIDGLATKAAVDLADITAANLTTAVDDAYCSLQGRTVYSEASPQAQKAIVLYLLSQLP